MGSALALWASKVDSVEKSGVRMRWRDIGSGALHPIKNKKKKSGCAVKERIKKKKRLTDIELAMLFYPRY